MAGLSPTQKQCLRVLCHGRQFWNVEPKFCQICQFQSFLNFYIRNHPCFFIIFFSVYCFSLAFSALINYYFKFSFDLKAILYITKDDLINGRWAALTDASFVNNITSDVHRYVLVELSAEACTPEQLTMWKKLLDACNNFIVYSSRVFERNSSQLMSSARHEIIIKKKHSI